MIEQLATAVAAAMITWSPAKDHSDYETPAETEARYGDIAGDIAEVADDPNEAPLPGMSRYETAIQIAAMGFFEGRFWAYVDDGRCNKKEWRKDHPWADCDGGLAWSLWQIHTRFIGGDGIKLVDILFRHEAGGYTGPDLVKNRKVAVRVALHMLRGSLLKTKSLCGYTGESSLSGCPKAKKRREFARAYVATHPFGS